MHELILATGDDQATSPPENGAFVDSLTRFDDSLNEADEVHDHVARQRASHSFFDRGFAHWRAEWADARIRMLAFIDRNR